VPVYGVRHHVHEVRRRSLFGHYDHDANPKNFVYDAQVWIEDGSIIGNLEMDNNQVIPNGKKMIYAFQCAGTSDVGNSDPTVQPSTLRAPSEVKSTQPCNPAKWTTNTWHHIQIS